MDVEVTYKDKHGDNDLQHFPFEQGTTDIEIRETIKRYVGRQFGDVGIKITKDGKDFK